MSSSHRRGDESRKRARSPHQDGVKRARPSRSPQSTPRRLPFDRRPLHKSDLEACEALFAEYLAVQKRLDLHALSRDEAKGRWKSFLSKWNAGALETRWYEPHMLRAGERAGPQRIEPGDATAVGDDDNDRDHDDYGPALPESSSTSGAPAGPAIPTLDDLQHRRELEGETREAQARDLKARRKREREEEKARLEELAPRAEPGSRERQLEKKREAAAANRAYSEAKGSGGGVEEVAEGDLLGGDEEGVEGFKAKLKARERAKNEREIRKEEILRARAVEREERMAEHRRKEDKTMEMLRSIAKQRFG